MKRSTHSTRAMRHKRNADQGTGKGSSRYAVKRAAGKQMYGFGCCAHKLKLGRVAEEE